MKRDQEKLFKQWHQPGKTLTLIRPGLVYSDQQLADAHGGIFKSGIGFSVKHSGQVPLAHVDHVARIIVTMAGITANANDSHQVVHVIDEAPTSQSGYLQQLKKRGSIRCALPIPWPVFSLFTKLLRGLFSALKKHERIPDSFRKNSVAARFKPFHFPTTPIQTPPTQEQKV